jgi:CubicO group peptidase (beta-lactamase class C family)
MTSSGIRLDEIDRRREAVPYKALSADFTPADTSEPEKALARYSEGNFAPHAGRHFAFCRYSFATAPDGLLRTSVTDLARFISAWTDHGAVAGRATTRLLSADTVAMALGVNSDERTLGWNSVRRHFGDDTPISGSALFGHNGSDPCIGAVVVFCPENRGGFVMMFNTFYSDAIADDGLRLYLSVISN